MEEDLLGIVLIKVLLNPTLKDCVAGDLALVLPHRIITNILEGLEKLDKIIPGVNNDETLLYGPEIKFFSNEIETDNHFKLKMKIFILLVMVLGRLVILLLQQLQVLLLLGIF